MIMNSRSLRTLRGTVLTYGLVLMTVIAIIFFGLIRFVVSNIQLSLRAEPSAQALQIAEAGVYFYRWHLAHNVEGRTATQIADFWENSPLAVDDDGDGDCDDEDSEGSGDDDDADTLESYTVDYSDGTQDVGQYRICVLPPSQYSTIVTITSTGWSNNRPNIQHTVTARLRKPSWSEYAILSNEFMRLSEGTEIFGTIHVNKGFHFDGVAHNVVTSSVDEYYDNDSDVDGIRPAVWAADLDDENSNGDTSDPDPDDSDHFLAGKEFPVRVIDFDSATADFNVMRATALSGGGNVYFDTSQYGRYIEFGEPTSTEMRVRTVNDYDGVYSSDDHNFNIYALGPAEIYSIPVEGVVYVEDNVWIEGTVPAGYNVTVAAHDPRSSASRSIYLGTGDLKYASSEDENVEESILGLAAEENVQIIRYIKGDTSSNSSETLHVDGALLAQKGYIGWQRVTGPTWTNVIQGITINGAIVSNKRLGFGYTSGAGFTNRDLIFDTELLFQPPSLFPAGDSYAIDLWESQ